MILGQLIMGARKMHPWPRPNLPRSHGGRHNFQQLLDIRTSHRWRCPRSQLGGPPSPMVLCFRSIRCGKLPDRSGPASCRTGKCCNSKFSGNASIFPSNITAIFPKEIEMRLQVKNLHCMFNSQFTNCKSLKDKTNCEESASYNRHSH